MLFNIKSQWNLTQMPTHKSSKSLWYCHYDLSTGHVHFRFKSFINRFLWIWFCYKNNTMHLNIVWKNICKSEKEKCQKRNRKKNVFIEKMAQPQTKFALAVENHTECLKEFHIQMKLTVESCLKCGCINCFDWIIRRITKNIPQKWELFTYFLFNNIRK